MPLTLLSMYNVFSTCMYAKVTSAMSDFAILWTVKKRCPFHYRGLECKSRKSRNTWSNRQIWPWSTEWSTAKANRVLPRECTGHSKQPLPTTQEKTLSWASPDGQHWYQIDYILCSQRWKSSIQSAKTRPGADCGSDHELLIAKFTVKLKKVEKTTRPCRFDLNKIPRNYTVGVANRFKGLDLECIMNYRLKFVTLYRRQGSDHPQEKEMQKRKMAVWEGLTNSCEKKRSEKQRSKGKI